MCNCTSENLEIPGLVLTHHPGMTGQTFSASQLAIISPSVDDSAVTNAPQDTSTTKAARIELSKSYPEPIIDHKKCRGRALQAYAVVPGS